MKRTKRVLSVILAVLLIAVSIPFSVSAASDADSSLVLNRPKASMVVTEVTRVAYDETSFKAPTSTNSVIVKATPSGIPYTSSPNAELGYAGETPVATTISFTPGVALDSAPTISCNASVTMSDYVYSNGTYTWTVTGGTAVADTFLIFTVSYTYTETNAVTGKTYTRSYQTQGTSYVTPIATPAGSYASTRVFQNWGLGTTTKNRAYVATYILGANTYGSMYNDGVGDGSLNFNSAAAWSTSNVGWTTEYGVMNSSSGSTSSRNLNFSYAADTNRPVADVYLDKSIHSTLSDVNLRLMTAIPTDADNSNEKVTVSVNGLYTLPGIVATYSGTENSTQPTNDASVTTALGITAPTDSIKDVGSSFKMYFTGVGPTTLNTTTEYTIAVNYQTAADWTNVYLSESLSLRVHTYDKGALRTLVEDIQTTDPTYMTTEVRDGSPKGYNPQSWYYSSGWETFLNAYNAAKACLDQPNATQDQIDSCYSTLLSAHNSLTFARADYSVVDQYISQAAKLNADDYSLATWAKLQNIIGNYEQNYSALYQPAVDKLAIDIKAAMDNLKEADADYTVFNGLLASANKIVTETESLYGLTPAEAYNNWDGVVTALRNTDCVLDTETNTYVVSYYQPKSKQSTVDGYAIVLENALNALSLKSADYTEATKAENTYKTLDLSLIVGDGSELTAAYNALVALHGLDISHQSEVDEATATLNNLLNSLEYKPADTTAAKAIIEEANAIDSSKYTNYDEVTAAVKKLQTKLGLDIRYQSKINSAVADVRAAINSLEKVGADYTSVENAKTNVDNKKAEALSTYGMEASVLYSNWADVETAVNAVVYGLDIDNQTKVDAFATNINTALSKLSFNSADYTKVNEQLQKATEILNGEKIYTDESLAVLSDACNAVDKTKKIYEQSEVDAYATNIENAINTLEYIGADYTAVEEQVNLAKAELDKNTAFATAHPGYTYYTAETIANLQAALDAVDYTLGLDEQDKVTAYATAIAEAIAALTPAPADYTAVNAAIDSIPEDTSVYTAISVATLNATVKAVKWDLTADKQASVDKYATSINNAVTGLEYNPADYTEFNNALARLETLKDVNAEKYAEIKAYADTVKLDAKYNEQGMVDEATEKINSMLDAVPADYSKVNEAIAAANEKVAAGSYTADSVAALNAEIANVDFNLNFEQQSTVDGYYTAIVNATNNLVPDLANYTELQKILDMLDNPDSEIYTKGYNNYSSVISSINTYRTDVVENNMNLTADKQSQVDEMTATLQGYIDSLYLFKAADGSTTVISGRYIYGLKEKLTKSKFLSDYVTYENVTVSVTGAKQYLGTGAKVTVTTTDGTVVGTYYIVIYGDIDGNGMINYNDSTALSSALNGDGVSGAVKKAANLTGRDVTMNDVNVIAQAADKNVAIDQTKGKIV